MRSVSIPDDVFEKLARRAKALDMSVEQLIATTIATDDADIAAATSFAEWQSRFTAWLAQVDQRVHRYPPGFVMDDRRESIYEGCGE